MTERVSDERLVLMLANKMICGCDYGAVERALLDLRDARAELARLRAERRELVERAVRAGMEAQAAQALSVGGEREAHAVAAVAARILREHDAARDEAERGRTT